MKFKIGDRVRYISDKGAIPKGACGTIRKIEIDDGYQVAYVVRLDNKVGHCIDDDGERRPSHGYPMTLENGNWGYGDFIKVVE